MFGKSIYSDHAVLVAINLPVKYLSKMPATLLEAWELYVFDRREVTHICSFDENRWCEHVGDSFVWGADVDWDNETIVEQIHDWENDVRCLSESDYFHARTVEISLLVDYDPLPRWRPVMGKQAKANREDAFREAVERFRDQVNGNGVTHEHAQGRLVRDFDKHLRRDARLRGRKKAA